MQGSLSSLLIPIVVADCRKRLPWLFAYRAEFVKILVHASQAQLTNSMPALKCAGINL